jgi:hypothetical protein
MKRMGEGVDNWFVGFFGLIESLLLEVKTVEGKSLPT